MIKEIATNNLQTLNDLVIYNTQSNDVFESQIQKDFQILVTKRQKIDRVNSKYLQNKRGFIAPEEWEAEKDNEMEQFGVKNKKNGDSFEEKESEFDLKSLLLISESSLILVFWKPLEIFSYLLSSYYYAWLMSFSSQIESLSPMQIFWESIFLISMIINFLTEYTPDGETKPVREHPKIA